MTTPSTEGRLVSLATAAEYVGVNPKTIQRWIAAGRLKGYRFGPRRIRIDLDDVDAMLLTPIQPASDGAA